MTQSDQDRERHKMNTASTKIKLTILVLIVVVLAFGGIVLILLSGRWLPRGPIAKNANELKIPPLLEDLNPDPETAEYELEAQYGRTNFIGSQQTPTFGYNGSYLGPVIRLTKGEAVKIRVRNQLDFATTIHWHGLVVDGDQDGGPHQGVAPGETWEPGFTVDQSAATLWYHPHIMGNTADQVYYGLAGLIYIDEEGSAKLNVPKDYGVNDMPLIVQDGSFKSNGHFDYRISMMGAEAGDTILINGTSDPYVNVQKGNVRFRILNASNFQNFEFKLSNLIDFQQIASDGGFLAAPVTRGSLFLAPGERAEVVVDFAAINSESVSLLLGRQEIMQINIAGEDQNLSEVPEALTRIKAIPEGDDPPIRMFNLESMGISGTINGKYYDMDRIDEEVNLNETEIWVVRNNGGMMQTNGHPFHVHGTQFQIISRNGKAPPLQEQGFKDTVYVGVGDEVRLRIRFTHPGLFMYHCHMLEHEDNGMMGQFMVS
ncbi:MAG: multicopper oxidase domain-containing protein [Eubacteriales bacterium]|nr:multicopper oxidase domain-containing protein [Eubacteriales bacterium]